MCRCCIRPHPVQVQVVAPAWPVSLSHPPQSTGTSLHCCHSNQKSQSEHPHPATDQRTAIPPKPASHWDTEGKKTVVVYFVHYLFQVQDNSGNSKVTFQGVFALLTSSVWSQLPPSPSERPGSAPSPLCSSLPLPVWTYCLKSPVPQSPAPPTNTPATHTTKCTTYTHTQLIHTQWGPQWSLIAETFGPNCISYGQLHVG